MKKVININFQSRVIPIEETAYELLKQYIESLRKYFANEDGRDEIINDIENRIAELFSERLKKGAVCISDADVNAVIASMGRPEDFDAESADTTTGSTSQSYEQAQAGSQASTAPRGRLYRNSNDKMLGGVASGVANYLGIDPVVMRIIFVLLSGALFWVYILLWIVVPEKSVQANIIKRLYRSAEDKQLGGVCGGLAAYFNISTWIPRLIFALPLVLGIISSSTHWLFNDWNDGYWGPRIITGSLSSTLFITYIILWIVLPVANTAAEKLEMRGEKIDLNSIRNTVKEDLGNFKTRAQSWGEEVKQSAQQLGSRAREFGQAASNQAKSFSAEAAPVARGAGSGIAHIIGVLFKAFFLFIAGIIALSLFGVLVGLLFGSYNFLPLKDFLFDGFGQNMLAWATLILFLGVPLVGLLTWLIRRIAGIRSRNNYLGYVFGTLWTAGWVCLFILLGTLGRNFKTKSSVEEETAITQPATGILRLDVANRNMRYYSRSDWFGIDTEDWPFYGVNQDTLFLNTVRVEIVKSTDAEYHVHKIKFSRGNNMGTAQELAQRVNFDVQQRDSLLLLPRGFTISRHDKFRNQQVLVVIEVPVGKRVLLENGIDDYDWFEVRFNRHGGYNVGYSDGSDWDRTYRLRTGIEYTMTADDGPQPTNRLDADELKDGRFKLKNRKSSRREEREKERETNRRDSSEPGYRYHQQQPAKDSQQIKTTTAGNTEADDDNETTTGGGDKGGIELSTPLSLLSNLFQ